MILSKKPLGFPWETADPFLFCVHHLDHYPAGDELMGPVGGTAGRQVGSDFSGKQGWSMYHGSHVPGFPGHPHRGFETITIARQGFIDHSDSLGAMARFGHGDVQWMTAGSGVVHSEMFPLTRQDEPNTTELFQIWLNLPRASKMVQPHFTMFWSESIPELVQQGVRARVIAGALGEKEALAPPPDSWASQQGSGVRIITLELEPGAEFTLPAAPEQVRRTLYFFVGSTLSIAGESVQVSQAIEVRADAELALKNGDEFAEVLVLEGKPIGEPVVQHGPFVMNSQQEIRQAMLDYQRTQFGGWPWEQSEPTHARESPRFAVHADGRREDP